MENKGHTDQDWQMAATQFGYPPDIKPGDISYWDGGVKMAEVHQRARELRCHREAKSDQTTAPIDPEAIAAKLSEAAAQIEALHEALKDVTAHLVAAHSLLSRSPKTAAPSDRMFDQMLCDYEKSIEHGRAALSRATEGGA